MIMPVPAPDNDNSNSDDETSGSGAMMRAMLAAMMGGGGTCDCGSCGSEGSSEDKAAYKAAVEAMPLPAPDNITRTIRAIDGRTAAVVKAAVKAVKKTFKQQTSLYRPIVSASERPQYKSVVSSGLYEHEVEAVRSAFASEFPGSVWLFYRHLPAIDPGFPVIDGSPQRFRYTIVGNW